VQKANLNPLFSPPIKKPKVFTASHFLLPSPWGGGSWKMKEGASFSIFHPLGGRKKKSESLHIKVSKYIVSYNMIKE
jgi:hypothetical protein